MTDVVADLSDYNKAAIELAAGLTTLRTTRRASQNEDPSLDDLLPANHRVAAGVRDEWQRMGERHVSEALEARAEAHGLSFEHLAQTIGTVIHGVRLADDLSDALIAFIRDALLERKVIFFRDQHLTEDQQVTFGRRFGQLDAFPFGRPGANPFILEINHGPKSPGLENGWHTDVTWMEQPSLGSIAQCVVVPPTGGDTLFADSYAALAGLPSAVREQIDQLHGVNDYRVFVHGEPDEIVEQFKERIPFGVSHPLVRTHPETGIEALYIHGSFLRHDSLHDPATGEALEPKASRKLVATLLQQHTRPEYHCRFRWTEGSMAFWDNRAAQHYAASDYFPHRRVLRRVTVSGDRPTR